MTKAQVQQQQRKRIKQWVRALRSGKYRQARRRLATASSTGRRSYCCLGVACEIYRLATNRGKWVDFIDAPAFKIGLRTEGSTLPREVTRFFGFESGDPIIKTSPSPNGDPQTLTASEANDRNKWGFRKIADAIEKYYVPKKRRSA